MPLDEQCLGVHGSVNARLQDCVEHANSQFHKNIMNLGNFTSRVKIVFFSTALS